MDRTEAYKILRLDEAAEADMVQGAYWTLVRQARERGSRDTNAKREIDAYNEAYATLAPGAQLYTPPPPAADGATQGTGTEVIDRAVDWLSEETLRTRARWEHRNPEICVILGVTLFLMVLALGAGASFWLVTASVLAIVGAIWAPWRRVTRQDEDPGEREASPGSGSPRSQPEPTPKY